MIRVSFLLVAFSVAPTRGADIDYVKDVAPLLNKYCVGCHNESDREGGLSLQTFASLQRGGDNGSAMTPGNPKVSKLVRRMRGIDEPLMPPEDSPQPSSAELERIATWIDQGAKGPNGAEAKIVLATPKIPPPTKLSKPITTLDWSAKEMMAVGVFGRVEMRVGDADISVPLHNFPGKVTSVRFSKDGSKLVTTSGTTGLAGWAAIFDAATGKLLKAFRGHYDVVQTGALSPDGKLLATGSYDRRVLIWDVASGEVLRELTGHNGAIYDLDFSADSTVLATASGDETVKLWRVSDGERLDTLSQPEQEQYAVRFSTDDKFIVAGGADNRIRVWRFVSRTQPQINPLVHARFAHEGAVTHIRFAQNGRLLITAAEDRTMKVWTTSDYVQRHVFPTQPDVVGGMAVNSEGSQLAIGRLDGKLLVLPIPTIKSDAKTTTAPDTATTAGAPMPDAASQDVAEREPNNQPDNAQHVAIPAVIHGVIAVDEAADQGRDEDLYRIQAKAGQTWMLEINAARNKSALDSRIEVLHADGTPVQRVLLQAMRDSYFTFRGKDSDTSDDFRVHNWREMELNQYLYCNGEVVKLWHYPRGPDSGFIVYPGAGMRQTYFGTSPMTHALHEPCYIVRPLPVGAEPLPNGLPLFPIFFENDDDPLRLWGADSRLAFTAPRDGEYLVRITDIRGQQGETYTYDLTIRPRRPDFSVTLSGANPTINKGSGQEIAFNAQRKDGYEGPITITVEGLPQGIQCQSPIIIEPGQRTAMAVLWASEDAEQPTDEQAAAIKILASSEIAGQTLTHAVTGLGKVKIAPAPKVRIQIVRTGQKQADPESPVELTVAPGETITAEVVAERMGYKGRISLGKHDAGRNLPHGVFVDNIGLNGLMILEEQNRREFFITAAPFVNEQTRLFHLQTGEEGKQTTLPVLLHIRTK